MACACYYKIGCISCSIRENDCHRPCSHRLLTTAATNEKRNSPRFFLGFCRQSSCMSQAAEAHLQGRAVLCNKDAIRSHLLHDSTSLNHHLHAIISLISFHHIRFVNIVQLLPLPLTLIPVNQVGFYASHCSKMKKRARRIRLGMFFFCLAQLSRKRRWTLSM